MAWVSASSSGTFWLWRLGVSTVRSLRAASNWCSGPGVITRFAVAPANAHDLALVEGLTVATTECVI